MENNQYINSLLFHPRQAYSFPDSKDVLIDVEENIRVGIRIGNLNPNNANLLFFHGNGEIVQDYDDVSENYSNIGVNLICIGYRGYAHSNGMPDVTNILTDSITLFDTITDNIITNNNIIIVMGRSLGSVSACEIAIKRNEKVDALIIESGFANEEPLLNLVGIHPNDIEYTLDIGFKNLDKLKNFDKSLLVMHAKNDHIIPFEHGRMLFNESNSDQKTFIEFPNSNHNNILIANTEMYFESINKFLTKINK